MFAKPHAWLGSYPASSLKTVSHQAALMNIMFHSREWSTCLLNWGKMYGYSYIWHCQIGWSILLFIFIPEFIFDCSGSAGASVVAHGVALPLYRDCFLDLRLFNSPDLRRLVLCYCCQAWTLETVLGGNTALTRWWTARSIDADAKR